MAGIVRKEQAPTKAEQSTPLDAVVRLQRVAFPQSTPSAALIVHAQLLAVCIPVT
jgi:hypothetical protein